MTDLSQYARSDGDGEHRSRPIREPFVTLPDEVSVLLP